MSLYQLEKFIQDGQDPKVVERIHSKILDMLTPTELITYTALQKKPAVTLLPDSITLSNKRLFLCEFTKLGLATNFEIFTWHDIKDIAFKEEIFGSKVTVIPFTGENLTIDYIPKVQARRLYQIIKDALDNLQKKDSKESQGKITIQNPPGIQTPNPASKPTEIAPQKPVQLPLNNQGERPVIKSPEPTTSNPTTPSAAEDEMTLKLIKLKKLYDKQLITQSEYETKKTEILSNL
ncbi:MAG: PH domain-containing protein [Sphingobacterium sp.]